MSNPNRPSNAVNPARLVAESVTEMTEIIKSAGRSVGFHIFVVDENGVPKVLSYTRKQAWRQAIADLTGRDVHAFPFIGAMAPVSASLPPPAPQLRFVLMPNGPPLPLFDVPDALQPEPGGLMRQPYRELTAVHEDAVATSAITEEESEEDDDGDDDADNNGPDLI